MMNHCGKSKIHKLLMLACCIVPVLMLAALYLNRVQGTSWGAMLSFGAVLICPLMHLGMLAFMFGKRNKSSADNKPDCH